MKRLCLLHPRRTRLLYSCNQVSSILIYNLGAAALAVSIVLPESERLMIDEAIRKAQAEFEAGIQLTKCQQCGCMREALDNLSAGLRANGEGETQALVEKVVAWSAHMRDIRYACLGCDYCYPAIAQNLLAEAFPELEASAELACDFRVTEESWPTVTGEYFVLDRAAPVAISTLGSIGLAQELAHQKPSGLAIVGKTETENIGIDKVVKNIITNPSLHYLVVTGNDPKGHQPGRTLLALWENGIDAKGRVVGSPGKRPILRNVSLEEVAAFREQVRVVDMIGCNDVDAICTRVQELAVEVPPSCGCGCSGGCEEAKPVTLTTVPVIVANEPRETVVMDRAGYFVVLPLTDRGLINVEHYAYDNTLLHIIEGTTAKALYMTIIQNGWVTELSHAAYLGKELAKAEMSLQHRLKYLQDGA